MKMKKKQAILIASMLLVLGLALVLGRRLALTARSRSSAPEQTAPAVSAMLPDSGIELQGTEDSPAPEPTLAAAQEHEHRWDGESGICLTCGWACPHERHDAQTAICLRCGLQCQHHFGAAGVCSGCGTEAPVLTDELPKTWYGPAKNQGTVRRDTVTEENGVEHRFNVWLPYDYNANKQYNLVILIHGDNGSCEDWMDREHDTARGVVKMCWIYDHLTEEKLCRPFIVVSVENERMDDPVYGERYLKEVLLPYLARNYATYAAGSSYEQIAAAREHVAIGGMSRGSIYTYSVGMDRCYDVAANFCCFSNGYMPELPNRLNDEEYGELPMRCYVATVGTDDNPDYVRTHTMQYQLLCDRGEQIRDGENARFLEISGGHDYLTWYVSIYDALLLMF